MKVTRTPTQTLVVTLALALALSLATHCPMAQVLLTAEKKKAKSLDTARNELTVSLDEQKAKLVQAERKAKASVTALIVEQQARAQDSADSEDRINAVGALPKLVARTLPFTRNSSCEINPNPETPSLNPGP